MSSTGVTQRSGQRGRPGHPTLSARPPAASLRSRLVALVLTFVLVVGTLVVGWVIWSLVEWGRGRTASFQLMGLRVVRRTDGEPIGLGRSLVRSLCCAVLLVPTVVACAFVAVAFVMGASPPNGLLRQPRSAPWDLLTGTEVLDEGRAPMRVSAWTLSRVRVGDRAISMN